VALICLNKLLRVPNVLLHFPQLNRLEVTWGGGFGFFSALRLRFSFFGVSGIISSSLDFFSLIFLKTDCNFSSSNICFCFDFF